MTPEFLSIGNINVNNKINDMGNLKNYKSLENIGGGDRNRTDE